tara:strand:+ start:1260 stop:1664 length:405 start_codon:yes stop_codon:yes gene_type:complete
MKISKRQLKLIIREEYNRILSETYASEEPSQEYKLAELILSDNAETIQQGLDLAEAIGYIEPGSIKKLPGRSLNWHNFGDKMERVEFILTHSELSTQINIVLLDKDWNGRWQRDHQFAMYTDKGKMYMKRNIYY